MFPSTSLRLHVFYVSKSLYLHASTSRYLLVSVSPCLRVSVSPCLGLHVSMSPCLHVSMSLHMSPCLHVYMSPCLLFPLSPCLYVSMSMFPCFRNSPTENGTDEKWELLFVLCKRKTETANFHFFAENGNGKWTFVFLGRQTINSIRRMLC
jgi:hypothetical protein